MNQERRREAEKEKRKKTGKKTGKPPMILLRRKERKGKIHLASIEKAKVPRWGVEGKGPPRTDSHPDTWSGRSALDKTDKG